MQLQYRGQTYSFESTPSRSNPVAGTLTRTLHYRGTAFVATIGQPQDSSTPRTINWRYQAYQCFC